MTAQGHCSWSEIQPALARSWGQPYVDRTVGLGPIPPFGTPEWAQLDNADPRKVAACVIAAWWFADQHAAELFEQRGDDEALLRKIDEKRWAVLFASSRESWKFLSWAELQELRTTYIDRPPIDPEAVARWVATGSSEPQEVAA